MIVTARSSVSMQTIKQEMEVKAKEHGFGLLKSYEFRNMLQEKGFPIQRDITVFELCNPKGAQSVLENLPELSVYLPCRISMYEKDGVSMLSIIHMKEMMEASNTVSNDLEQLMKDIYVRLETLIHDW